MVGGFQQQQYTVLASNGDQRWAGWEILGRRQTRHLEEVRSVNKTDRNTK
jgi:hypothetical protein